MDKPQVTITGISGYIGSQVCLYFLKSGQFRVKGTVRSTKNPAKIDPLKKAFGSYFDELTLVEADLNDKQSIIRACEGSEYVVHTASPFPLASPKDEMELITPAVNGTLFAMEACKVNKVKRIVITSSCAAVYGNFEGKASFSHEDISHPDSGSAYERSKTRAEIAAWDFQKSLPESERFEVAVINPGLVLGPNLVTCQFTSGDIVKSFMTGAYPGSPKIQMPCVDVRDVAEAHFKALTVPEAANKRFILCERSAWFKDIATAVEEKYGKHYKVTKGDMPKCMVWLLKFFVADMKSMYELWGRESTYDNSQTRGLLGIDFIPIKKSVQDMGDTLIETGYVENKMK